MLGGVAFLIGLCTITITLNSSKERQRNMGVKSFIKSQGEGSSEGADSEARPKNTARAAGAAVGACLGI